MLSVSVCAETIGLTLLLLPTGGISSPFIWYALNPVLVAASFLTPLFCWGILAFYLGSATFIAYYLGDGEWMVQLIRGEFLLLSRLFIDDVSNEIILRTDERVGY